VARARRRHRGLRPAAAALTAGVVAFGGLAAAGALPGPLQRASANLGEKLGIELPAPGSSPTKPAGRDSTRPGRERARSTPAGTGTHDEPSSSPETSTGAAPLPALPAPVPSPVPLPLPTDQTTTTTTLLPLDQGGLRGNVSDVPRLLPIP
jgi:hypothetical protein